MIQAKVRVRLRLASGWINDDLATYSVKTDI